MATSFESKFFEKRKFEKRTVQKYFNSAERDFEIAKESKHTEAVFKFSYDCLIKIGIALIAAQGHRVKSRMGHHVRILEKLSKILNDKDIEVMGEAMRKKRNRDLYDGGIIISGKEAKDYLDFVKIVLKEAEEFLKKQKPLF